MRSPTWEIVEYTIIKNFDNETYVTKFTKKRELVWAMLYPVKNMVGVISVSFDMFEHTFFRRHSSNIAIWKFEFTERAPKL